MKLFLAQIGEFTIYKTKDTYDEECYLAESHDGQTVKFFSARWYSLDTIRKLLITLA